MKSQEKHNKSFRNWAKVKKTCIATTKVLNIIFFQHILESPFFANMHGLKEEATKFLINQFHNGFLSLESLVPVTLKTIYNMMGLPYKGDKILMTTDINFWLQELIRGMTAKN